MRNGAIKKKEEMGYKKQDTPYAGCGQAPGAASKQVPGSVSRGLCVKLHESGDKGWGQRGTGNRAGLDGCGWAGSPEVGRPGRDHPLESRLWALVSGVSVWAVSWKQESEQWEERRLGSLEGKGLGGRGSRLLYPPF